MYSGIPAQQPKQELEREIEPVSHDPQPKVQAN